MKQLSVSAMVALCGGLLMAVTVEASSGPTRCCGASQYETLASMTQIGADGKVVFSYLPRVSYSYDKKMIAVKEVIMGQTPINATTLLDFGSHTMYNVIDSLQLCTTQELPGEMEGQCVSDDAKFIGPLTLGHGEVTLEAESWMTTRQYGADMFVTNTVLQKGSCVHVTDSMTNVTASGQVSSQFLFYFNYSDDVKDPSVFTVPEACRRAQTSNTASAHNGLEFEGHRRLVDLIQTRNTRK